MKPILKNNILLSAAFSTLLFSGCASNTINPTNAASDPSYAKNVSKYESLSREQIMQELNVMLDSANKADMPFLAPAHYAELKVSHEELFSLIANKATLNEIAADASKFEILFQKSMTLTNNQKEQFKKSHTLKLSLDNRNAKKIFNKEYVSTTEKLSAIITNSEMGNNQFSAKEREEVIKELVALEHKVIIHNALNDAKIIMEKIKEEQNDYLAPKTFQSATIEIEQSEIKILQNPYDSISVQEASEKALFAAKRAKRVTDKVRKLMSLEPSNIEKFVLEQEDSLYEIGKALEAKDIRDRLLEDQALLIKLHAASIVSSRDGISRELSATQMLLDERNQSLSKLQGQMKEDSTKNMKLLNSKNKKIKILQTEIDKLNTRFCVPLGS